LTRGAWAAADAAARLCGALAHPARLRVILALRAGGERCVSSLCDEFGTDVAVLSHQLAILRRAGLVRTRRDGHFVFYRLAATPPPDVLVAAAGGLSIELGRCEAVLIPD
jgi:DNA-binding transcriptional ArsR family regulator